VALAAAALAAGSRAQGPEGSGNLALSLVGQPGGKISGGTYNGFAAGAVADAPLFPGLALRGDLSCTWLGTDTSTNTPGYSTHYKQADTDYVADLALNLYPAAWAGAAFQPGVNANPDGWLWWPGLSLGFNWSHSTSFTTYHSVSGAFVYDNVDTIHDTVQALDYEVALPVATWLSVGGDFTRNLREDTGSSSSSVVNASYGLSEGEGAWVDGYIDLVSGAGADLSRPFLPHFGRLGQLMVSARWSRLIMLSPWQVQVTNDYGLTVGAPLSDSLSAALSYSQLNDDTGAVAIPSYQLMLTWAFGDPKHRT
jgi:hypothetical protein